MNGHNLKSAQEKIKYIDKIIPIVQHKKDIEGLTQKEMWLKTQHISNHYPYG